MIERTHINWISTRLPSHSLLALDKVLSSVGQDPLMREVSVSGTSPIVATIVGLLSEGGAEPAKLGKRQEEHQYHIGRSRQWEQSDVDAAEYLWLNITDGSDHPHLTGFVEFDNSRIKCVEVQDLPKGRAGFVGDEPTILCPDSVKIRLEGESFAHLRFVPVKVKRRVDGTENFEDVPGHLRWWQLTSDLVLPPMSPAIERIDPRSGNIVPQDYTGHVRLREPPFSDFQPRYARSEWKAVPRFDVAGTHELWLFGVYARALIVSKRFYLFCQADGLRVDWAPVRIED